ncbi:hypothetical protein [Cyclobacterium roseum]|uniref:hypothetical protein n=1 Tax=Cyclobacterium roseum TaxID=2666137 RepID=UPI001F2A9B3F|nr:hypothetical protein [Cyclobacterium roseum]
MAYSAANPGLQPPKIFVFETFGSNLGGTLQNAIKISSEKHELRPFQRSYPKTPDAKPTKVTIICWHPVFFLSGKSTRKDDNGS